MTSRDIHATYTRPHASDHLPHCRARLNNCVVAQHTHSNSTSTPWRRGLFSGFLMLPSIVVDCGAAMDWLRVGGPVPMFLNDARGRPEGRFSRARLFPPRPTRILIANRCIIEVAACVLSELSGSIGPCSDWPPMLREIWMGGTHGGGHLLVILGKELRDEKEGIGGNDKDDGDVAIRRRNRTQQ